MQFDFSKLARMLGLGGLAQEGTGVVGVDMGS